MDTNVAVSAKDKWAIEAEKRFGPVRVHSWPIDALPLQTAIDKELQKTTTDAVGRRVVDKLVKVWLKSGEVVQALVHVEIQGRC